MAGTEMSATAGFDNRRRCNSCKYRLDYRTLSQQIFFLATGVVVAWAHIGFGKRTGLYESKAPARSSKWKRQIAVYGCVSAILLLGTIAIAVLSP